MKSTKKLMALLLTGAMILQTAAPVFASTPAPELVETTPTSASAGANDSDPVFRYVAIGDSVAAGFNLDSSTPLERAVSYYSYLNYNRSAQGCYPHLVSSSLTDILISEGYIDEPSEADFTNLGLTGYRTGNFSELMQDEDYILDSFYNTMIAPYARQREHYLSTDHDVYEQELYAEDYPALKALLDAYYATDDPDGEEICDTVLTLLVHYGLEWESFDAFRSWYEENASTTERYEAWFTPWHKDYFDTQFYNTIFSEKLKLHDIFCDAVRDADFITVDVGSNDLLILYLAYLMNLARGEDAVRVTEESGFVYYENLSNPLLYSVSLLFASMSMNSDFFPHLANVPEQIAIYKKQFTSQNLVDTLEELSADKMKAVMTRLITSAMAQYAPLQENLARVKSEGKDGKIVYLGRFAALGNSLDVDGVTHDFCYAARGMLKDALRDIFLRSGEEPDTPPALKAFIDSLPLSKGGKKLLNIVVDNAQYPFLYMTVGRTVGEVMQDFNAQIEDFAKSHDALYVDVYNIPNETDGDPHPKAAGHQYIANQILDAIAPEITLNQAEGGTLSGPERCVYGHDVTFTAEPKEGWTVDHFEVNGERVEAGADNQLTLTDVTADTEVGVVFVNTEPAAPETPAHPGSTGLLPFFKLIKSTAAFATKVLKGRVFYNYHLFVH